MITLVEFGKFFTGQIAFYIKNETEHNMFINLIKQVNDIFINIDTNTYDKYLPYYAISNNECDCYGTLTALKMETHIKEIQEFKIARDFKDLTDDEIKYFCISVFKVLDFKSIKRTFNKDIECEYIDVCFKTVDPYPNDDIFFEEEVNITFTLSSVSSVGNFIDCDNKVNNLWDKFLYARGISPLAIDNPYINCSIPVHI